MKAGGPSNPVAGVQTKSKAAGRNQGPAAHFE
jgi:hypothetical protein